ncbi:MAG TPA: condensation domain-containing protein, partial [Thermoanaerobaculia bacterium]|nr:condensation domain-containing protein [Thermoanaerobaculia bacterium]
RAIVNRLLWMQDALHLSAADRVLQKTPFSFDVSVWELFWPLMTGARQVVAVPGGHRDNAYLVRLIQGQGITVLHFVPSMLQLFLEEPGIEACSSLRDVVCSGEALPAALARRFAARLGHTRLHNLYGPTEAAVDVTSWVCEAADVESDRGGIPIGRPIANTRIHLLDRNLLPVPVGVPGELFIAGVNLARGYVERPDLTAERFLPDPEGGEPGGRVYRTGDLARWRGDGAIEFLGRLDHQVKIRGVRIELGEVEAALLALPGVREAVVVTRSDRSDRSDGSVRSPGDQRLVAYVVGDAPAGALRSGLRERLPEPMVPAAFVRLAALPLNANGKVDRKSLPAPEPPGARAAGSVAPRTREEEVLAAVWAQVLRLPRVGVNDNFFELGGDSILSVQLVARARQAGLRFTMRQVFEHQTVAALARHATATRLAGAVRAEQGPVLGEVPLTPIQRWFFAQGFAEPHHFNQALLLEPTEPLIPATLEKAMAAVVEHHDALRLRFALQADGWHQENARTEPVAPFHQVDLSGLPATRRDEAFERAAAALQAGFDLTAGPLTRLCLFHAEARTARLLWVAHHLVVDGVSWRVLVEDLERAYRQVRLPPKTTSFQEWARRTTGYAAQAGPEERETARAPVPRLPVDFPSARDLVGDEATVSFELSAEETSDLLQTLPSVFQSRIDEALLSALVRALAGWTGSPRLRVDLEGHGREPLFEDLDVSRTVGWFTSLYPVVLEAGDAGPGEALVSARERLRAKGLPGLDAAPKAEILFNYLGQYLDQTDATSGESSLFQASSSSPGPSRSPRAQRSHPLEIVSLVAGGRLRITLTYGSRTHAQETAERLAAAYAGALRQLLRHGRESEQVFTPSDTWSPLLVPIQPLGARAPLFCVHALGGEVLGYYQLARQLGTDQPVYGLQARPLDGQAGQAGKAGQAEAPQTTIEEMAAEYLDAVRGLQPAGPYLLAGYSFGGVVAFEMARQLTRAGEEVALLAILDQPVSPGDEAAAVDTAAIIAEMLKHHARGQGRTLELDEEALRGLPLDDQLARGLEVLGGLEALGPGFDVPLLRDLALGWSSRATAVERYRVAPYPGKITLVRASDVDPLALREVTPERRQVFADPTLGWGAVAAGGVEVHLVPGSHQTIVAAPHVEILAEILGTCIARAERGPGRTMDRAGGLELDAAIATLRT